MVCAQQMSVIIYVYNSEYIETNTKEKKKKLQFKVQILCPTDCVT